jgi:hypothetical protein
MQWGQQKALVFHCAQVVRDPVSNKTLGVAMGTSKISELSDSLRSVRPKEGVMYVTKQQTGQLLSSSDERTLWNTSLPVRGALVGSAL